MSRLIFLVGAAVFSGCAVAPLGFYESAFPSRKTLAFRSGLEFTRGYDEIVEDIPQDTLSGYPTNPSYTVPITLIGADFSPVPFLSFGAEGVGLVGLGLRSKGVLFSGDNAAAALILKAGYNSHEESDSWGGHEKGETTYLVGGGMVSLGNPFASFGVGPKVVFSRVDITQWNKAYSGNVLDYGGFINLVLNYGFVGVSAEGTLLALDRPLAKTRTLKPYGGLTMRIMF
ncbi:MAG: hypothetical protein ABIM19_01950 [candidate division WOR-3 bacterium]